MTEHDTFSSPFTWRYGSDAMRRTWSEAHKRRLWRRVWVALAEAQVEAGVVTQAQAADLRAHCDDIDIPRALAIEADIRHDLMAELKTFAAQCPTGGGVLHLGATSADIEDNADALRIRQSLDLILDALESVLAALAEQIERWADTPAIAYTHLQPAEPTTVGYRLALYGQDLLLDWEALRHVRNRVRGKGLKGAVGTGAAYAYLLHGTGVSAEALEAHVMSALGLDAFPITAQTYPRKQDWLVLNTLAGLAGSLYKLAFDLRILQSAPFGEWAEPFGRQQIGSSAMPFKRNPIASENIDSLARWVAALPRVAWDNAAHSLLERTLDDKANRRVLLPEAFLATDEMLIVASRLVRGLQMNKEIIAANLVRYGAFAATERLLMALGRAGADRQAMHEVIRRRSLDAWAVDARSTSPTSNGTLERILVESLAADPEVTHYLAPEAVRDLLKVEGYLGHAPEHARAFAQTMRDTLAAEKEPVYAANEDPNS